MYTSLFLRQLIDAAFLILKLSVFARVILSWFPGYRRGFWKELEDFVFFITEPVIGFFRRFIPVMMMGGGGIDFSPLVALIVIDIVHNFIQKIV